LLGVKKNLMGSGGMVIIEYKNKYERLPRIERVEPEYQNLQSGEQLKIKFVYVQHGVQKETPYYEYTVKGN
jgi:hypothetical protein